MASGDFSSMSDDEREATVSRAENAARLYTERTLNTTRLPLRPFDDLSAPEFPIEVLPAPYRNMVRATAESMSVPNDLPGAIALATIASLAQRRWQIKVSDDWREVA